MRQPFTQGRIHLRPMLPLNIHTQNLAQESKSLWAALDQAKADLEVLFEYLLCVKD